MTDPLGPPLGRLSVIGTPYHGLVRGGQLTLPNAQAIDYPQPDGPNTFLLDLGAPAVGRSTEQQAWDAERGFQWRTVATLSGWGYQYAGHNLQGWVWQDAAGDRWLVSTSLDGFAFGAIKPGVTGTVTFRPFGRMGVGVQPGDPVEVTVSLADSGQGTPDDIDRIGQDITAAEHHVVDIRPDGGAAIIMLGFPEQIHAGAGIERPVSLGFLELTLSGVAGSLDAQLSVLRTREQTLGTETFSASNTSAAYDWDHGSDTTVQNLGNGTSRHTTTFYDNGMVSGSAWAIGETSLLHSITGRIVSMYYVDGTPHEVTLSATLSESVERHADHVHAGEYVRVVNNSTGEVLTIESDTRETLFEHAQAAFAQKTYTLTAPGGSVSVTGREDGEALAYQYIEYAGDTVDEDNGRSSNFTSVMDGVEPASCQDGWGDFEYRAIAAYLGPLTEAGHYGEDPRNRYLCPIWEFSLNCQNELFWSCMAWAFSNRVHGFAAISRWHPSGRATIPGYVTPSESVSTLQDFEDLRDREFATWDPVTGAVGWLDRDADSDDAVCFV